LSMYLRRHIEILSNNDVTVRNNPSRDKYTKRDPKLWKESENGYTFIPKIADIFIRGRSPLGSYVVALFVWHGSLLSHRPDKCARVFAQSQFIRNMRGVRGVGKSHICHKIPGKTYKRFCYYVIGETL
jgi:hypothetical protein